MDKRTYTIREAADLLGLSIQTVREAVAAETLPSFRLKRRGRILIPAGALHRLVDRGRV
jgi:excisionase family DNA binding protein